VRYPGEVDESPARRRGQQPHGGPRLGDSHRGPGRGDEAREPAVEEVDRVDPLTLRRIGDPQIATLAVVEVVEQDAAVNGSPGGVRSEDLPCSVGVGDLELG
jgi:hypothetical protein